MGIISAVKEFIVNRGFTLMLIGISTAIVGVLLFMFLNTPRYAPLYYPQIAMGIALVGFAVYFTGRVSVYMQRNENKRKARELLSRDGDDEAEVAETSTRQNDENVEFLPKNGNESGDQ